MNISLRYIKKLIEIKKRILQIMLLLFLNLCVMIMLYAILSFDACLPILQKNSNAYMLSSHLPCISQVIGNTIKNSQDGKFTNESLNITQTDPQLTITATPTPAPSQSSSPTIPTPENTRDEATRPTTTSILIPTPTPTVPLQYTSPVTGYDGMIETYGAQYRVDANILKKIASCESGFNPNALNGPYGGMYQFAAQTWINTRSQMGRDTNPDLRFDAKEAIMTAAFKISRDGTGAWANCAR